jgi:YegS/Rv2252/BmrU family lipid kinase
MSDPGRFLLLVNPSAGGGRAGGVLEQARAALDRHGASYRVVMTRSIEHGIEEARSGAAGGETPTVVSGDGLIGQVGGALAGGEVPLGVIPGGRGNDFARVVGIPTDAEAAVGVLVGGHTRRIDVGKLGERRFLCIASCGFDSDANRIANDARFVRGSAVYAYAALRALAGWKPATFTLTLDGETTQVTGYSVAVANSKAYGGGMFVAPDAELDDGLLDVVTTAKVGKLHFLRNLPKVFDGSHVNNEEVVVSRAAEVRVEADRPFAVYADGDHLADLPVTVSLLPQALRVIVPAS